jgi:hypothetical protein
MANRIERCRSLEQQISELNAEVILWQEFLGQATPGMKPQIIEIILELAAQIGALEGQLGEVPPNDIEQRVKECKYAWTSRYRIIDVNTVPRSLAAPAPTFGSAPDLDLLSLASCDVRITVRIRLNPDPDVTVDEIANLRLVWEQGIQARWSRRFLLARVEHDCSCPSYAVTFDVQFVASNEHFRVRVRRGPRRSNMTTWHTTDGPGTAAHEFGHMLGLPDEYADDDCPLRVVTNDGSIMQTTNGAPRLRHYAPFGDWISRQTCCTYVPAVL